MLKKENGSDCIILANKASSVTLLCSGKERHRTRRNIQHVHNLCVKVMNSDISLHNVSGN